MSIPTVSGLYIVTLNNTHPISVNAQDPRRAETAVRVTRENCKVGRAKNLAARAENYQKTFGQENVNFFVFALTTEIEHAEKAMLLELSQYRIRGRTGRRNEWLENIVPAEALSLAVKAVGVCGITHELINVELNS